MAVYLVSYGTKCHVGFLPKPFVTYLENDGILVEATNEYTRDDNDKQRMRKFHKNCGSAEAVIMTPIFAPPDVGNFSLIVQQRGKKQRAGDREHNNSNNKSNNRLIVI